MGDPAPPPPPPPYESPSERRRAHRESRRGTTHIRKEGFQGVQARYGKGEVLGAVINPHPTGNLDRITLKSGECLFLAPGSDPDRTQAAARGTAMAGRESSSEAGQNHGGRPKGSGSQEPGRGGAAEKAQTGRVGETSGGRQAEKTRAATYPVGLLMAPPGGGGEQGGLVERPTRPKPSGHAAVASLLRQRALLGRDRAEATDGNWDDGEAMEEPGFRQGAEAQIGGIVDMEDDVYLEFDEEEEVKKDPGEAVTWQLMARYMATFKPNTKAMFTKLVEEAWHLRTGIDYAEKGKNYYMITLFSKGDYDFVKRGGPWIFKQNALIVKDFDNSVQPSAIKLDAVPVWVRIYDVPFGKQDETWGMRYGGGLGEALEVDVPDSELKKQEFLRVRVNLPYDRRLQTQLTTGVKGKPREVKVFKLKYERVPYYCSHCGFMGHKKDDCEKRRIGIPSLDYDAHELRCSPFKKFEHRSHSIPPAGHPSARRGISFSSYGSAESHKRFGQEHVREARRKSLTPEPIQSRSGSVENEMPPLMDDIIPGVIDGLGRTIGQVDLTCGPVLDTQRVVDSDGFEGKEVAAPLEEELNLAAKVDALQVEASQDVRSPASLPGRDGSQPIIQFPEEEIPGGTIVQHHHLHLDMTADMLARMQRMQQGQGTGASGGSWAHGPRPSDMIPALQGLSSLQVSFGSASDTTMIPADTVLGKRGAEEQEVQGQRLDLSLGLNYGDKQDGGTAKKGKMQTHGRQKEEARSVEVVYKRNKKMAGTGHTPSGVPYTYDNKRSGQANVQVRLDRAVANTEWRDIFGDTQVEHVVSPVSDHCMVVVRPMQETRAVTRGPRRHYEIWWERAAELPELIASVWEEAGKKDNLGDVCLGLDRIMQVLQNWSKKKFGNLLKELGKCRKQLEELLLSNNDRASIRRVSDHMNELLYREEMLWMQRSRINWLKEGDRNTKYFHQQAIWRARKNRIKRLKDENGVWKDVPPDMEKMATEYFTGLFTRDPNINYDALVDLFQERVTGNMNDELCKEFSEKEISDALFQIGPLKAPGLWEAMRECWDLPPDESLFGHNPDWFLHSLRNLSEIQRAMLMMTLWRVWHNHNELTHQKKPAPVESSKRFLQSYLESLLVIKQNEVVNVEKGKQVASYGQGFRKEKHQGDGRQKVKQKWMPPEVGTVKLNVDGAFDQDGHAGAGMILRDEKGEVIIAACRRLQNCSDALEAELAAMEEGIDLALHWSSGDITLESDCLMAIKLTGEQMVNASRHAMRINVIRERFKERRVAVKKISREANGASHGLAQLGRVHGRTAVWLRGFPSEIASAITLDCTHLNF
ncbi:hypothetical protein ACQ4PT_002131 [Festuca glaucescens]